MAGWVQLGLAAYSMYDDQQSEKKRLKAQERALDKATAPTLDEAAFMQTEQDRKRKRRGLFSNIYAGENASKPTVRRPTLAQATETLG